MSGLGHLTKVRLTANRERSGVYLLYIFNVACPFSALSLISTLH